MPSVIGEIADAAAVSDAVDQPGLEQDSEIGRHGVLADAQLFADLARGHAFGPADTSSRNTASRVSWLRAEKASKAVAADPCSMGIG
jgi:hypothetical protein